MNSIHFLGEWFDCRTSVEALREPAAIRAICVEHVMRHRVEITHDFFTRSGRDGVAGALMTEDMHLIVRTFPECGAMNLDLYVGWDHHGDIAKTFQVLDGLRDDFKPRRTLLHRVQHGMGEHPSSRAPIAPTQVFAASH
ncbi:S-adenosylmethionine decarboxylase [Dyella subtropica]|uniref:S-adenosylmethionine decarboxylase n=1 Tax=Dyella subtropica TaxID=2992127 RepID=UPI002252FBB0|nr:S-adenosylmethionine decarboxylase [Dyella subtropica]